MKSNMAYSKWYFRNGAPCSVAFRITEINESKGTAVAISPRGHRPRVWTKERLNQLNAEQVVRREKKKEKRKQKAMEEVPGLQEALTKAWFLEMSGPAYKIKWMHDLIARIVSVAKGQNQWSVKRAQFLLELIKTYEERVERFEKEQALDDKLREDPNNWINGGRQQIVGKILSKKDQTGLFNAKTRKVLIRNKAGQKFYGTLPPGISNADVGETILLTALIEPKKEDPLFAFFTGPVDASVVGEDIRRLLEGE